MRRLRHGLAWGIGQPLLGAIAVLTLSACSQTTTPLTSSALNSPFADSQPALSGNGRYLAFVSNRGGSSKIVLYDLRAKRLVDVPAIDRGDAIAETPSLSYTGRYLVYVASDRGRPEIELYDRISRRIQVLTNGYRGWVRNPNISDDGRYVVFETGRRGQWDIEVLDRGPGIELDRADGS
ncbi:MAG: biopolymer transporter Tol [Oscillatoriales cyanobacterium]|nr:MAG: biopolymer transporter Tol [Oscillatoriales cyanobacterium]